MGAVESWINERISKNKNLLASFVGDTGSGKSFAALTTAVNLDPEFNVDRVVFSAYDCLKIVYEGGLKPGSVIVYDESGVSTGHMDFQQKDVIAFTKVLQTFREENYILLFTLPSEGLLVKAARGLTHMRFSMDDNQLRISKKKHLEVTLNGNKKIIYEGVSVAHSHIKKKSMKTDKDYWANLKDSQGNWIRYKRFETPPADLLKEYLLKKAPFLKEVQRLALESAKEHSPYAELTDKQRQVYNLYEDDGMTQTEIAKTIGITQTAVSKILRAAKKKGYNYNPKNLLSHKPFEIDNKGVGKSG